MCKTVLKSRDMWGIWRELRSVTCWMQEDELINRREEDELGDWIGINAGEINKTINYNSDFMSVRGKKCKHVEVIAWIRSVKKINVQCIIWQYFSRKMCENVIFVQILIIWICIVANVFNDDDWCFKYYFVMGILCKLLCVSELRIEAFRLNGYHIVWLNCGECVRFILYFLTLRTVSTAVSVKRRPLKSVTFHWHPATFRFNSVRFFDGSSRCPHQYTLVSTAHGFIR